MKITQQFKSLTLVAGVFAVLGAGILAPSAQAKGNKRDKEERKEERKERKAERKERREDRREDRPDYSRPRPGYGHARPGSGNYNPNYGSPRPRPGGVVRSGGYTGEVVNVISANRVDVRIGGRLYNVYLTSRLPRGVNRGDIVHIDGVRQYGNDIRNARLQIIRNR